MKDLVKRFVRGEEGATMVEYGLMVALIAVVCIVAVSTLGIDLSQVFTNTAASVNNATAAPVTPDADGT